MIKGTKYQICHRFNYRLYLKRHFHPWLCYISLNYYFLLSAICYYQQDWYGPMQPFNKMCYGKNHWKVGRIHIMVSNPLKRSNKFKLFTPRSLTFMKSRLTPKNIYEILPTLNKKPTSYLLTPFYIKYWKVDGCPVWTSLACQLCLGFMVTDMSPVAISVVKW